MVFFLKTQTKTAHPAVPPRKPRAGMTKPKKPAPKRPNECGILRSELQKMSVKERTRVYTRGTAMGLCGHCPQKWRPVVQFFLPNTHSEKTARRAAELQDASDDLMKMYEKDTKKPDDPKWVNRRDKLVASIVDKRTTLCIECTKDRGLSPAQKECKKFWEFLKWAHCKKNNGCANKKCTERGMSSWVCISADHGTNPKVDNLSDYTWWAWNGGVEAMLEESKKCTWPCMACHTLRPTGSAGKKRKPKTLTWEIARDERIQAKEDFNDALKLARSTTCEYDGCNYPITKKTVRSIHWSHRDATQKATHDTHPHLIPKSESDGGIAAMIKNHALAAALHAKVPGDKSGRTNADDIKGETQICDANCANCHTCRRGDKVDGSTNPVRGRRDDSKPKDNPWVQSALKQRQGGFTSDKIETQRRAILKFESPIGKRK